MTRTIAFIIVLVCLLIPVVTAVGGSSPSVTRVSIASDGTESDADSWLGGVSGDGRFVAFTSNATTLVPGNTDGLPDVFRHDLLTGETELASLAPDGSLSSTSGRRPDISRDGRFVVFSSPASNLVISDTNGFQDVFVRDMVTQTTVRVSVGYDGSQANGDSYEVAISDTGRYVAFTSGATNLIPGELSSRRGYLYVYDLALGVTKLASAASDGTPGNGSSFEPAISGDGRFVAFRATSNNLVPGEIGSIDDIYLHDLHTVVTTRVSTTPTGMAGNGRSFSPSVSGDGRYVAFSSDATDLIPGDTNHARDIFLYDRTTGALELLSVSSAGIQGNYGSGGAQISTDGRYVTFTSGADNLVTDPIGPSSNLYLRDRESGETRVIIPTHNGDLPVFPPGVPQLSADGRYIAFETHSGNIVPRDTNFDYDVFVYGPLFPWSGHVYIPLTSR